MKIRTVFLWGSVVVLCAGTFGTLLMLQDRLRPSFERVHGIRAQRNGLAVFTERIPGSAFHSPDATWWGYNQTKIVRRGNHVYMYVVENADDKRETVSRFTVYKKEGDGPWKRGASFPTSRPGNILVDARGVLHAFVFQPTDAKKNDSWGKLVHYWFPTPGDIQRSQSETIIENDGTAETVNIRVGAAMRDDDTMAVVFGLTTYNPLYRGHSEHLYTKKASGGSWLHSVAGENLGHDWYYPFVAARDGRYHLLAVQDDFVGEGKPNIYQQIMYFLFEGGRWRRELIANRASHPLARTRPRLLEQEDLYEDVHGRVHILYKEFLNSTSPWSTSGHMILRGRFGVWEEQRIDTGGVELPWIRLVESGSTLTYLGFSADGSLYAGPVGTGRLVKIARVGDARGAYLYVATSKSGTRASEPFVDVLLLAADAKSFQSRTAVNYYIRIPKAALSTLR